MEEKKKVNVIKNINWVWVTLAVVIATMAIILSVILVNNHNKTKMASTSQFDSENIEQNNIVKQEELTDVSNMTDEELQKINEEELKKAEEKEKEENTTNKNSEKKQNTTSKPVTTSSGKKYYVKVNYGAQIVDVYSKDSSGKYTNRVKTFACSTGTATPKKGVYRIPAKITWCHMFGDVYAHYCTQIVGNILFHSVPYLKNGDPSTLEYWEYDKLGTKASMGCIRLTVRDAKWIFNNVSTGTQVEFYSDPSQASRRPSTQKISNAPQNLRGWDPTDPDSRNPWKTYKPKPTTNTTNNNTQTTNTQTTNTIKNQVVNNTQTTNVQNNTTNSQNTNSQSTNTQNTNTQTSNTQSTNSQKTNTTTVNNTTKPNTTTGGNTQTTNTNTTVTKPNNDKTQNSGQVAPNNGTTTNDTSKPQITPPITPQGSGTTTKPQDSTTNKPQGTTSTTAKPTTTTKPSSETSNK